ncbi:RNA polymerase sigma factor [Nonomuraea africana]|uniref:RNA polymerase sigma-70 factor (ECF subfamily) n=1 Tax=Nonomuraea africana TaxID=46171 RepID=A0ABR9KMX0_9ACTN|nr:sigma-70 family RNA polymerase sigma factor [Nonomuraea africana]MBE1563115.1 RNA polymerase sigma-70 factor (ECF subfamily) [Nonomuraea africana]
MGSSELKTRFEEIYSAHYPAVATYIKRRTDAPDDIADAIAETFTTAWRRIGDVPKGEEARLWLYGVARRVLANHFRAEERRTALAQRLREEVTTWAEAMPVRDSGAAYEAFRRLSGDDRELLALVAWEGLSSPEIAKVLGCSHGAVRIRLHRARKRLARELAAAHLDLTSYGPRAVALAERQS